MFITFEGGEGSGKTTVIQGVAECMRAQGMNVVVTREPGGSSLAEKVRDIVLSDSCDGLDKVAEAMLYATSRRIHLEEVVKPALSKENTVVLCDRYIDSSFVYQGYVGGLGFEKVKEINEVAIEGVMPDITVMLDVTPEVGLERIQSNGMREVNRFDRQKINFHYEVRKGYMDLAGRFENRIKIVDADMGEEDVMSQVKSVLGLGQKAV